MSYNTTLEDIRLENRALLADVDVYKKSILSEYGEAKKEVETIWLEHSQDL